MARQLGMVSLIFAMTSLIRLVTISRARSRAEVVVSLRGCSQRVHCSSTVDGFVCRGVDGLRDVRRRPTLVPKTPSRDLRPVG